MNNGPENPSEILIVKYRDLYDTAFAHFLELARGVLRARPELTECINAMGRTVFCRETAPGEPSWRGVVSECNWGEWPEAVALKEFLLEWDDTLHISGDPCRFTADGSVVTDW